MIVHNDHDGSFEPIRCFVTPIAPRKSTLCAHARHLLKYRRKLSLYHYDYMVIFSF